MDLIRLVEEPSEGPVSPEDFYRTCRDQRLCDLSREIVRRWRENPERWENKDYLPMAREWAADLKEGYLEGIASRLQSN